MLLSNLLVNNISLLDTFFLPFLTTCRWDKWHLTNIWSPVPLSVAICIHLNLKWIALIVEDYKLQAYVTSYRAQTKQHYYYYYYQYFSCEAQSKRIFDLIITDWQCHSGKSKKFNIIYCYFPLVRAKSWWTESWTVIGGSRGPDLSQFSPRPLQWWPFDYFHLSEPRVNHASLDQQQQQQVTTEVGQYNIISALRVRFWSLEFLWSRSYVLLIFGLIFPHLFTASWVSNNCRY